MSSKFEPPRPRWPVRAFNGGARLLQAVGLRQRALSAQALIDRARRETGLRDLGSNEPEEALDVLVRSFEADARLSPFGRMSLRGILLSVVKQRLKVIDVLKRHPEIDEVEIRSPIFVIGFPRTGTTLTYNLLARDPGARPLLTWESALPTPPPECATPARRDQDRRVRRVARRLHLARYLVPELDQVHEIRADGPEECQRLLCHTLLTAAFAVNGDAVTYLNWMRGLDDERLRAAYRFYRQQLQLLSWKCAGNHWVLKSPAHLQYLRVILDVFPDACIVQTHREPLEALPSLCSLGTTVNRVFVDGVDPVHLGRRVMEHSEGLLARVLAARERLPAERVVDVRYTDLVADPVGTVTRIYRHFGREVSPAMASGMEEWLRANPRHKHGKHQYSLEQFGLDAGQIERRFAAYRQRFLAGGVSAPGGRPDPGDRPPGPSPPA